MTAKVPLRPLSDEEPQALATRAQARTAPARLVDRARIIQAAAQGQSPGQSVASLGCSRPTVSAWIRRFHDPGLPGLAQRPRAGRPHPDPVTPHAAVLATALTDPPRRGLPFGCWTLDRLHASRHEQQGIPIPRRRSDEILRDAGLCWRQPETWFGARGSRMRRPKGAIETLSTPPPEGGVGVGRDARGPERATSVPGQQLVPAAPPPNAAGPAQPTERAKPESDDGRRGPGDIVGAFRPATGAALTHPAPRRHAANGADFRQRVAAGIPAAVAWVEAIVDNLPAHRAVDVRLVALAEARWEFVVPPKDAAYLNRIEPWWKVLRSRALKGRRCEPGEEVGRAVAEATASGNQHRPPWLGGRRRRHRPRRRPGIASVPDVRGLTG